MLVTLSLATAALGLALMLLGRLKLASLVQYLPMPVSRLHTPHAIPRFTLVYALPLSLSASFLFISKGEKMVRTVGV